MAWGTASAFSEPVSTTKKGTIFSAQEVLPCLSPNIGSQRVTTGRNQYMLWNAFETLLNNLSAQNDTSAAARKPGQ
jgi:hypothetical protein